MKRIFIFFSILIVSIVLCSCNDTRIVRINNIIWKDYDFSIVATSSQLQKQNLCQGSPDDEDYYSSIILFDVEYSCFIGMANNIFALFLFDSENSIIHFYGEEKEFLCGFYGELKKEKEKEFKYSLTISLTDSGQYYEYCMDNDKIFPSNIILYGYEQN